MGVGVVSQLETYHLPLVGLVAIALLAIATHLQVATQRRRHFMGVEVLLGRGVFQPDSVSAPELHLVVSLLPVGSLE